MELNYFDTLQQAKKHYSRILEPVCRQWELTRNELDVLLYLYNNPGFDRAADIVKNRGMAKSHVSLSVSNLEQRGLLLRREDPKDRRTVHLELTEQAKQIAAAGRDAQERFFLRIYNGISHEEMEMWRSVVGRVIQNILEMESG